MRRSSVTALTKIKHKMAAWLAGEDTASYHRTVAQAWGSVHALTQVVSAARRVKRCARKTVQHIAQQKTGDNRGTRRHRSPQEALPERGLGAQEATRCFHHTVAVPFASQSTCIHHSVQKTTPEKSQNAQANASSA